MKDEKEFTKVPRLEGHALLHLLATSIYVCSALCGPSGLVVNRTAGLLRTDNAVGEIFVNQGRK